MKFEELRKQVLATERNDYGLMVRVKGSWLIQNNLVDVWKEMRNTREEITNEWEDWVMLYQAEVLGLIEKM